MKLSEAKTDVARVEQGAWVDKIPELEGLRLKVRGSNNKDWRKLQLRLYNAVPRKKRMGGSLDPAEQDRITNTCLVNTCLLDWDGLEDDEGKPIPFSKETAAKILNDEQYARLRDGVLWAATVVGQEDEAAIEDDAGN